MGLDCFWMKKIVDESGEEIKQRAKIEAEICLAGGLYSGFGNDSFRGKVYNGIVEKASNVSLYQEWIENETVLNIAESLEKFDLSNYNPEDDCSYGFDISETEFQDLKKMFRLHADAGHGLYGWW